MRQGNPQQHGFDFLQSPNPEVLKAAVAGDRVGTVGGGRALFVNKIGNPPALPGRQ
jgi:hypothetical protein